MSAGLNSCEFIGNIGKKETKFTPNGTPKTTLSIAVNERRKVKGEWTDVCTWIPAVLWGSENLLNYLEVGKQVFVKARYESRTYEQDGVKKYAHDFTIESILLLGGGGNRESQDSAPVSAPRTSRPISQDLGVSQADLDETPF